MVGILLALQVQTWNEERRDRIEEYDILSSIATELRAGLSDLALPLESLDAKDTALDYLKLVFRNREVENNKLFLSHVSLK